jgi:hypothetical protein
MSKNTMAWSYRKKARHRNPPKKNAVWKAVCNETKRKTKNEMADDVSMDLRKMGVSEWRGRARNQEAWRRIVEEAKAHPGL